MGGLLEHRSFGLIIVLLWCVAYLPGLGARDLRLEEGRRAGPAREMLDSGDYVRPTIYGETYLNKPPLYYWLVAATSFATGNVTPLTVRLPAAISVLACSLAVFGFAPTTLSRCTRSLAALLILASTAMLAATQAMAGAYATLKTDGSSATLAQPLYPFQELSTLMGFQEVWDFEKKYAED